MERSKKDWMKTVGKQRDGREGIFIRLSEVPTNELHKYLYLYFMFYLSFNYQSSITIWIRLTEIYKMTIACFKPTISVGSTLTHVRFITWTTQCTCWLVVRSCEKELRLQLCVPSCWRHWWSQFCAPISLRPSSDTNWWFQWLREGGLNLSPLFRC